MKRRRSTPIGNSHWVQETGYTPQYLISNLPASLQPSSTLFYYSPQEEDLLLQQAALQQTGKASLVDGLSYDSKTGLSVTEQEKAYLYQNALTYAETSNLQLGVALTQTQISALDRPMLWYVEQTVPDPSCKASGTLSCPTITALMPQIYLPQGTGTMTAGGNITGNDVTLNFNQSVVNTGSVTASNTLSVTTGSLVNQANQVNVGQVWSNVAGGYVETTGTTVQPGGFMSAANMDLNVQTLTQVGGALQALNTDGSVSAASSAALVAQIQSQLGGSFTQSAISDDLNTSFVKAGGSFSMTDLAVMVVAVAASIATYGAASGAIGMLATSAGSTLSAATAASAGVAATSAGLGNIVLSAAAAGMVSSAASQIVSTGGIDLKQMGSAGLIAGVTAGLLNGITYNGADGIGFNTGVSSLNAPTLANLAGIQNLANSTVSQAGTSVAGTVAGTAAAITATSAISAAVQTAVGGGSLLDNFEHAAVSGSAAAGAFEIGELQGTGQLGTGATGELAYLAAHAALGCASSAALGTGCGSGAIGGAASGGLNQLINSNGNLSPAALAGVETLVSGSVAGAFGLNVQGAATAAQNETLNNYCSHNPCGQGLTSVASSQLGNKALNPLGGSVFAISCGGSQPCDTQLLSTILQAQGANADQALANMKTAAPYIGGALGVALLGSEAVTAAALAGGFDYEGDAVSYAIGLSKDVPSFTKSYITGIIGGLTYPLAVAEEAIAGMGTGGKIMTNGYNAVVAGTGAFGSAAITNQGSPDAVGGFSAGSAALGGAAKVLLPGSFGNFLNNLIQGLSGPFQNAVMPGN